MFKEEWKKSISVVIVFVFVLTSCFFFAPVSVVHAATNYYVSNSTGNDNWPGTQQQPWKTLAKVSSITFQPGDKILLKRGDVWNEPLVMHGSGTSTAYIEVSAYGTGARPMIKRNGVKEDRTIWWQNYEYVKVSSITVRDAGMGITLWSNYGIIDDCIAINIKGLYGTSQPEGAIFSGGLIATTITNSESYGAGACSGAIFDRLYIHDASHPGTTYAGADYQWVTDGSGSITRCLFDKSVYSASLGTSAIMFKHVRNVTVDNCIIQNAPHTNVPDECGIDFEDDNQYVTIQNTVFKNNAGPAIEFLRGGDTQQVSSNVEIKNCKFIQNNWAHTQASPSEIQVVNWNSPNKPLNISIHDNQYTLASGVSFFGGDGDKTGCTLTNNTQNSNITYNHEPNVNAGADKQVSGNSVNLSDASASDDGTYTVKWEQLSGPGVVTFNNANAINTTANFPANGTYELRLIADDGTFWKTDYVTCTVGAAKEWLFNTAGDAEGWTIGNEVGSVTVSSGYYNGTSLGTDPYIYSGDNLNVDITNNKTVTICFKNSTSNNEGRLYFITNADQTWNEAKDKVFSINANDANYTVYTLDMSTLSGWTGTLKRLRFDPSNTTGQFSIDYIKIGGGGSVTPPPTIVKAWEFTTNVDGWASQQHITGFAWQTGGYAGGTITGIDPYLHSATNLGVSITNYKKVRIRMKNSTTSTLGQLYFITNADGTWDEAKRVNFTITANDPSYTEYLIDMTSVPGWTGTLKRLRLDPNSGVSSGTFSLDYIQITN